MQTDQPDLFRPASGHPEGLRYQSDFLSAEEERVLSATLELLPFKPFEFHGFLGKRKTVSFGYHYAFDGSGMRETDPIPPWLLPLRDRAADFGGIECDMLQHVLLTLYEPGAGIGWHKDRSVFDDVVGISLLAPARLRFRRQHGSRWQRAALVAKPRSAYLLSGPSRSEWEHSIPPLNEVRFSITFRSLSKTGVEVIGGRAAARE